MNLATLFLSQIKECSTYNVLNMNALTFPLLKANYVYFIQLCYIHECSICCKHCLYIIQQNKNITSQRSLKTPFIYLINVMTPEMLTKGIRGQISSSRLQIQFIM